MTKTDVETQCGLADHSGVADESGLSSCMDATLDTEAGVVISGVSGRLPKSDNMTEFKQHLLSGIDMTTEDDPDSKCFFCLYRAPDKIVILTSTLLAFFLHQILCLTNC